MAHAAPFAGMTRPVQLATLAFLVAIIAGLVWSAQTRAYNPDEFQHVQMAWLIAQGQVPNRDFFEHHTYFWHLLAAPALTDPTITRDGDAAVAALLHLRWSGVALALVALVLTERLGRTLFDPLVGRLGAVVLAASAGFLMLALEIRPDQLALCLLLVLSLLVAAIGTARRIVPLAVIAGAVATLAVLTTQKIVFAAPGLVIALAVALWMRGATRRETVEVLGGGLIGVAAVLGPFALWLNAQGALMPFVQENFFLGADWPRDTRALVLTLAEAARDETLLLVLAALGGVALSARDWRGALGGWAGLAPMVSLLALMPLFPVVQRQYLLLALPYAALLAGLGLATLMRMPGLAPMLRHGVTIVFVGGVAVHGALALKTQETARDETALRVLRHLVETTPPGATVLRSWSPGIAFRRPVFRYFSLHPEITALITPAEWDTLARGLETGQIAPAAIEMDRFLRAGPPRVVAAIERGWTPTGIGDLWVRKPQASTAAP